MKESNPSNAVKLMIEAYSEKRRNLSKMVKSYQSDVDGLRKNARRDKREEYERRLRCAKEMLEKAEQDIHDLDSLETVIDEYMEVHRQIDKLCEKRRELCPSSVFQAQIKTTMRDGKCFVM